MSQNTYYSFLLGRGEGRACHRPFYSRLCSVMYFSLFPVMNGDSVFNLPDILGVDSFTVEHCFEDTCTFPIPISLDKVGILSTCENRCIKFIYQQMDLNSPVVHVLVRFGPGWMN